MNHLWGLVAPGHRADIVLLDDLERAAVSDVYAAGRCVVKRGVPQWRAASVPPPSTAFGTVVWKRNLTEADLRVPAPDAAVSRVIARVVEVFPGQVATRIRQCALPAAGGAVQADLSRDVQYFALAERYCGNGDVVNAFVSGFGLTGGAMASSVAHDHHHLVAVGASRGDMAAALNRVAQLGGGQVAVQNGKILAELPLPLWGLLSERNAEQTAAATERLREAVRQLGWRAAADPFAVLSLVCLPVIPEAGFTDQGLIDVREQRVLPVLIDPP